ncbi:MAG: 4Fe-4S binding protein [Myxococcales bacterium]
MSTLPHAVAVPPPPPAPLPGRVRSGRLDLFLRFPRLRWLAQRRWFQFAVVLPNLGLFLLFLSAGIFGTPVGNRNIIIVFVWILWWFLLISALVPFASRIWCTACPFPFFGEWVQRRALIRVRAVDPKDKKKSGPGTVIGRNRYFGKNLKWPKSLSNIWLQNIGFLALCTFSALFLTRPIVSVIVLGSLFLAATVLHLIYRQRTFCSYVCPVSGFLSLFSMASMAEVRPRDLDVCSDCTDKGCLAGSEKGWGCPWLIYPSKLERNNYCGLCMECVKSCPHENMTVNLRPFLSDTRLKGYDEAFKAFIMLSLALAYSAIYLGPWAFLKDWANIAEKHDWAGFLLYAGGLWTLALLLLPGSYYLTVRLGARLAAPPAGAKAPPIKDVFLGFVQPLVPLGLLAWVAFSVPLMMVNGSYILGVISDPFGWGWNLFGTAQVPWTPVVPHWTPYIQVSLLLLGLFFALRSGATHAMRLFEDRGRAARAFAPVSALLGGIVLGFFALYVG